MNIRKLKYMIKKNTEKIINNKFLEKRYIVKVLKNNRKKKGEKYLEERIKLFRDNSQECLEKIKETLDRENIKFWLDFGTLLGAIREQDFIKHDFDIDIGVFYNKNAEQISNIFNKVGIEKIKEFKLNGEIVEQCYSYKGIHFDIFYYFVNKSKMWTYSFVNNSNVETEFKKDKDISRGLGVLKIFSEKRDVEKILFKGKEFYVPENPHGYLEENYGKNYMTPIKEWDYCSDPKNQELLKDISGVMIEYVERKGTV